MFKLTPFICRISPDLYEWTSETVKRVLQKRSEKRDLWTCKNECGAHSAPGVQTNSEPTSQLRLVWYEDAGFPVSHIYTQNFWSVLTSFRTWLGFIARVVRTKLPEAMHYGSLHHSTLQHESYVLDVEHFLSFFFGFFGFFGRGWAMKMLFCFNHFLSFGNWAL